MRFLARIIVAVCVVSMSSTIAFAGEKKTFEGRVTGVVTPTTIDTNPNGHPASLTLSSTREFTIQRSSENDSTGLPCDLPDGSTGSLTRGVPIGVLADGTVVRGWEVWHHRQKESSLIVAVVQADTCFGAGQVVSVGEGRVVGGTGDFAGATGKVVTSGTNVNTLAGGLQAVQPYGFPGGGPPFVWYFVSIDGEYELTIELP